MSTTPTLTTTLSVIRLHCITDAASASRGAINDYNDWLAVVSNLPMDPASPFTLPPCPMEIVADHLFAIEARHLAVRLTQVRATLMDLRLADLMAYHKQAGTVLGAQELYYDLLTPPIGHAQARLDGMKRSTIVQIIAESQAKSVYWTVGQVMLFIGARWAWDLDANAGSMGPNLRELPNPLRQKDVVSEWDDAKARYIYELARYYDGEYLTYQPPCKVCRASRIPFPLQHPIFSVPKCVTCVCSKKSCNKSFLLGAAVVSPLVKMEAMVKLEVMEPEPEIEVKVERE
ncbi:uncharacterized protein LOC62_06G008297 [Vanrija pseudolonga]|uniref:Uncharacterized protein n=1 Tax=Vanrija pseudolonga TaxID=143232 RepID=A0AAF0YHK9_9TREE|nr:hypothetical protein LOC62_06G008297 [Vanrija pseudolonga]